MEDNKEKKKSSECKCVGAPIIENVISTFEDGKLKSEAISICLNCRKPKVE